MSSGSLHDQIFARLRLEDQRERQSIARLITEHFTGAKGSDAEWEQLVQRVNDGEPVQYVLEFCWFYNRKFEVGPAVLIPRPETEELVYQVLQDNGNSSLRVLDIGTGSGCIPIILKTERPEWSLAGIDISPEALEVAQRNAMRHAVKIDFREYDFLAGQLHEEYDVIISNPPYVSNVEFAALSDRVRQWEPRVALGDSSGDPLIFYRRIVAESERLLSAQGVVYLELNEFHANEIQELYRRTFGDTQIVQDMQGKPRILRARQRAR